jgi:hypothetical protein
MRLLCICLVSFFLAACGVVESTKIDPIITRTPPQDVCSSDLGSYALPKAFVHIVVGQTGPTSPPDIVYTNQMKAVEVILHPDRANVYCLDYLASPLAHDVVNIQKSKVTDPNAATNQKTSFLGAVTVNATDRTVYIIEALLRAASIVASGSATFTPREIATGSPVLVDLEYDPFDPRESAEVNARLTSLGLCLVLEGGSTLNYRNIGIDAYCNAPRAAVAQPTMITKAYQRAAELPANPHAPGLQYRPRMPYRLFIFRKPDPNGGGHWKLSESQVLLLENISPVLSLDIERAAFAGRNANFLFSDGALTTACVAKASEIEGFVDIPLQISRSIVAIPSTILSVRINQLDNEVALTNAESQLYQIQAAYLAALSSNNFKAPSGISGTPAAAALPVATKLGVPSDLATSANAGTAPPYDTYTTGLNALCTGGS